MIYCRNGFWYRSPLPCRACSIARDLCRSAFVGPSGPSVVIAVTRRPSRLAFTVILASRPMSSLIFPLTTKLSPVSGSCKVTR